MKVSFHGFKNVGAYMYTNETQKEFSKGSYLLIVPKGKHINLHAELNNEGTSELDDFKVILKAFPNPLNKNSINIAYDEFIHPETKEKEKLFVLNNNIIELNDETFPIFNKVFKLLEKIKNAPAESLKVENSYVLSAESQDAFKYYTHLENMDAERFCKLLDDAHTRFCAKEGASRLNKRLQTMLTEYFFKD